ncbi:MAG: putative reverse transcriptase, partial [Streblomastix strix]
IQMMMLTLILSEDPIQEEEQLEEVYKSIPLLSTECINWENVSVPDRLTYRIQEWNKLNAGIDIQTGATPNWTSIEALHQLEAIQKYKEYHAPLPQMLEYARQLEKEIKEGIVIQTDQIRIINPTFLVPKPSNKWRKILDCRQVNAVAKLIKFKIEGSEFIKQILEKQDFATTLDLEEAFHHIKVSSDLLPYFGFAFQRRLYTYSGLPFGYKNSPYHFNKVLSIAIRAIRQRWNIKISNYIDDMVLLHPDKNYLKHATQEVIAYLQNLGFKIQLKKCRLFPSRIFNYLGWVWNAENLEVKMTPQRRRMMKKEIKS